MATDINECLDQTHNCGQHAICNDTHGSFTCSCVKGYMRYAGSSCLRKSLKLVVYHLSVHGCTHVLPKRNPLISKGWETFSNSHRNLWGWETRISRIRFEEQQSWLEDVVVARNGRSSNTLDLNKNGLADPWVPREKGFFWKSAFFNFFPPNILMWEHDFKIQFTCRKRQDTISDKRGIHNTRLTQHNRCG